MEKFKIADSCDVFGVLLFRFHIPIRDDWHLGVLSIRRIVKAAYYQRGVLSKWRSK